jgi:Carboxypeptidase regulatory-like domain
MRLAGSNKGSRALDWHVWRMCCAILSLMMAVVPAWTQSPVKANSQNRRVSKGTQLGVDVTVVDPTNAVIRKANVILSSGNARVGNAASTDSRGIVRYRSLSKGTYDIIVQARGFRTVRQTLTVKKMERLRVKLQIAVKTETVEVTAAPVVVDTVVNLPGEPLPYVPYIQFPRNPVHLAVLGS